MAATFEHALNFLRKAVKSTYFLALPAAYLAGQAYHEGYLKHFNIDVGLLPLALSETYTQAFIGSVGVFTLFLEFITRSFSHHPILASCLTALMLLLVALVLHKPKAHQDNTPSKPYNPPVRSGLRAKFVGTMKDFGETTLVTATLFYAFFAGMLFVMLSVLIIIKVFMHAGDVAANKKQLDAFRSSATAHVRRSDNGLQEAFKIIGCNAQFCALYSKGTTGVVTPASSIIWIDHEDISPAQ